jgi:omega-amidase
MKNILKIAALQSDLHWENPTANRAMFEEQMALLEQDIDLVMLPEMFTTGFSMRSKELAEPVNGPTQKWMQQQAARLNSLVIGSYIVNEAGQFYNRLLAVAPDGQVQVYNKRHLFRMGGEHEFYMPGQSQLIVTWQGWRIMPLVCYDLRFPVWSRNLACKYDLLLYVANWPAPRAKPWRTLLQARAIENQCYLAGLNRIGVDGQGLQYQGDSLIIDFKGELMQDALSNKIAMVQSFDFEALAAFRQKFPAHLDADNFSIL